MMIALDGTPESCLLWQSSGWCLACGCGQEVMGNWAAVPWSLVLIEPEPLCGQDLQGSACKSWEIFLPVVLGKVQQVYVHLSSIILV